MAKWAEKLLQHTGNLPQDSLTTIKIDCPSGYTWEGPLWDLRDVLEKALAMNFLQKSMEQTVPIATSEMIEFEPPKWEYRWEIADHDELDEIGADRWEAVLEYEDCILFKRPIREKK